MSEREDLESRSQQERHREMMHGLGIHTVYPSYRQEL